MRISRKCNHASVRAVFLFNIIKSNVNFRGNALDAALLSAFYHRRELRLKEMYLYFCA